MSDLKVSAIISIAKIPAKKKNENHGYIVFFFKFHFRNDDRTVLETLLPSNPKLML